MNPYPFVGLNHFTVPVAISVSNVDRAQYGSRPRTTRAAIYTIRPDVRRACLPGDDSCKMARRRFNRNLIPLEGATTALSVQRFSLRRSPPLKREDYTANWAANSHYPSSPSNDLRMKSYLSVIGGNG
jgi:hypothetical protein